MPTLRISPSPAQITDVVDIDVAGLPSRQKYRLWRSDPVYGKVGVSTNVGRARYDGSIAVGIGLSAYIGTQTVGCDISNDNGTTWALAAQSTVEGEPVTLVLSPTTSSPGGNVTASGTADRKVGTSLSCRLVAEGIILKSFTVPPNNKYSVPFAAPTGANRTVAVQLQQPNGSGTWSVTATTNLAILSSAPPPPTFPGVPQSLAGTAGNTTVALTWSAPASNGGLAITSYRVYKNGALLASPSTTSYTAAALTNGTPYQFSVSAVNLVGEGVKTAAITVTPVFADTTPPVISNVAVTSITQTSAVVSWLTNEPATGQVYYGLTSVDPFPYSTASDATYKTSHVQTLTGLVAGSTYYFQIKAVDAAGNLSPWVTQSPFTVSVPPPVGNTYAFPANGTLAQFLAKCADMTLDVITLAAGTYHWQSAYININRSARPLTVRPAPGAAVIFDGNLATSSGGQFYFGLGGAASYFTFEFAGVIFTGYNLGSTGIVWMGNVNHITFNGPTVQNITSSVIAINSWALYLSVDGGVAPTYVTADDWTVRGTAKNISAFQVGHPPSPMAHVYAHRWTVDSVSYAIYAYDAITDLQVSDWNVTNSVRDDRPYTVFFGSNATGTYKNMHVGTGGLESQGGMTNGGGNVFG